MTLYLLRQQPDRIPPSLFRANDVDMEDVFLEQASSIVPSPVKGSVVIAERMAVGGPFPTLTYEDLVKKIFSSEHIIVL